MPAPNLKKRMTKVVLFFFGILPKMIMQKRKPPPLTKRYSIVLFGRVHPNRFVKTYFSENTWLNKYMNKEKRTNIREEVYVRSTRLGR